MMGSTILVCQKKMQNLTPIIEKFNIQVLKIPVSAIDQWDNRVST
jgi:hypothetical protein